MIRKKLVFAAGLGLLLVLGLASAACQGPAGPAGPPGPAGAAGTAQTGLTADVAKLFNSANTSYAMWAAQPGTAPRMLELTEHFNIMWFAAQEGNWDAVNFEAYRVEETIKANVIVRPGRKAALEAWSKPSVEAIQTAAKNKNLDEFTKAYDNSIAGCNGCHTAMGGGPLKTMIPGYKIIRPTTPMYSNIDLKP